MMCLSTEFERGRKEGWREISLGREVLDVPICYCLRWRGLIHSCCCALIRALPEEKSVDVVALIFMFDFSICAAS